MQKIQSTEKFRKNMKEFQKIRKNLRNEKIRKSFDPIKN